MELLLIRSARPAEDQRSIANRLANETEKEDGSGESKETREYKQDPTLPVRTLFGTGFSE